VGNTTGCVRIDEAPDQGGFIFSSTIPGSDGSIFYNYEEVFHFLDRVKLGYFDAVADRAEEMALKFGPAELTPLTAEHAAKDYPVPAPVSAA
jgi:hypothetical protein